MALSEREQQILAEIERHLAKDNRVLRYGDPCRHRRRALSTLAWLSPTMILLAINEKVPSPWLLHAAVVTLTAVPVLMLLAALRHRR